MPYSINLRSNNDSADVIRSLWSECELLEDSPSMAALNYPPHITLAIYDDISEHELFNAFDIAMDEITQITSRVEHLGCFEAPHAIILWAAPTLPSIVHSLHARIHSLIDTDRCRPNYRPGAWVPHCSLATTIDLSKKAEAVNIANRSIEPFEVVFDTADCALFLPVEVVHEKNLPADS